MISSKTRGDDAPVVLSKSVEMHGAGGAIMNLSGQVAGKILDGVVLILQKQAKPK